MSSFIGKLKLKVLGNPWGWKGNYATWKEAEQQASGYDSGIILHKVKDALLKVKSGEAVYERDSVLFDEIDYSWPLLAALMWIAAQEDGVLNLIDFGGSLGSSYFQNRAFLQALKEVKWNIVEQPTFVQCGRQYFQDEQLKFYETIDLCKQQQSVHTLISSSTIQYLENPYDHIDSFINESISYIIFDLVPMWSNPDRITVQKVPPSIYEASYPCWILNEEKFLQKFEAKYNLVSSFVTKHIIYIDGKPLPYKGYIFKRK
jgi:putative methyltransferase (TIGR04325 family)